MEQITLRETAEKFAISPYYLSHQFTSILGMPFVNYVQKVRIRYALQMLSYTGARIHDIITGCGFSSSSQFNRTFSAYCGMSPSAFRRLGTSDRENIINTVNPELTEFAPSNLPPRHKLTQRRKGCHLIGVAASSLSPQGPESLSESMKLLSADTVMLDIPACFPSIGSYSALSGRKLQDLISAGISISAVCVRGDYLEPLCSSKQSVLSLLQLQIMGSGLQPSLSMAVQSAGWKARSVSSGLIRMEVSSLTLWISLAVISAGIPSPSSRKSSPAWETGSQDSFYGTGLMGIR